MFVIGNFISALANLINFVLGAYMWVIVGRAIISWVNPDPSNPIVRFLYDITEPVLSRIRRVIPFASGAGIDFSPMILILVILFLQSFVVPTLHGIARSFG
ncbi:MAG: YggT family protein [Proteobacteria bacterium]|nr:YggT family protein [Pseudomonadota bacterium]MBU4298191.1 YggT family protein [Pseudomonadota bacterium]MCG2748108.1 YggT family protein [Desulfobulbaceae bacterium]